MKSQNITGFTLHDRETGIEIDKYKLINEVIENEDLHLIDGFVFRTDGKLFIIDGYVKGKEVYLNKYDVHWKFAERCLVLTFDENAEYAVLAMPKMDQELAGCILAFFIRYFAQSMVDNGVRFIDVFRMISTAANYGIKEILDDKEKRNNERNS